MSTPQLDRELDEIRVVDFRLAQQKEELEVIYAKQDELLRQLYQRESGLYDDFKKARAERIQELAAKEKENYWLLQTWTF